MNEDKKTRYDVIPISEKTRKGMTLKIDDLGAIGRMLSLQDNAYDEQFDKLFKLMDSQQIAITTILEVVQELKKDVDDLKIKVMSLENKIGEVSREVKCTKGEIEVLEVKVKTLSNDIEKLKKVNTLGAYIVRAVIASAVGISVIRWLHGPFI